MTGLTSGFLEGRRSRLTPTPQKPFAIGTEWQGVPVVAVVGEPLVEVALSVGQSPVVDAGGDVANTAHTAVRLGVRARLGCRVGDDGGGRLLQRYWSQEAVDARWVAIDSSAPTGLYVNDVIDGHPHMTYYRRGSAGSRLSPSEIPIPFFDGVAIVHTSGITAAISTSASEAATYAFTTAASHGVLRSFALNIRPALDPDPETICHLAAEANVVFASGEDLIALFGSPEPGPLIDFCRADAEVVISNGSRPAILVHARIRHEMPPPPVEVVDTTGAGDCLAGAYLAGRLEGQSPLDALQGALTVASLSCRTLGCATALPPPRTTALDPLGHPPG